MLKMQLRTIAATSFAILGIHANSFALDGSTLDATTPKDPKIAAFETAVIDLKERDSKDKSTFSIAQRMAAYKVPGAGVAVIDNNELIWAGGYGFLSAKSDEEVDKNTVFSAGSVSKIINAVLILRLVQDGKLELDTNVNEYLTSWRIPASEFNKSKDVTLRQLLAHTSGFSQHGFPDFQPNKPLPTAIQTLNGEKPAKTKPVVLMFEPGSQMDYSGGGTTVSQVIVEDVTGLKYEEAAKKYVFAPLKMNRSTFSNPLPESHGNIAKAHNKRGKPKALPRGYESMPELAASGLWTSAYDMGLFLQAILANDEFLKPELRAQMLSRQTNSWHGLGPRINGDGDQLIFHHGGANDHYKSWMEGHPASGSGVVILTNGEQGKKLGYEIRISVGQAFDWFAKFPEDYSEPSFD